MLTSFNLNIFQGSTKITIINEGSLCSDSSFALLSSLSSRQRAAIVPGKARQDFCRRRACGTSRQKSPEQRRQARFRPFAADAKGETRVRAGARHPGSVNRALLVSPSLCWSVCLTIIRVPGSMDLPRASLPVTADADSLPAARNRGPAPPTARRCAVRVSSGQMNKGITGGKTGSRCRLSVMACVILHALG